MRMKPAIPSLVVLALISFVSGCNLTRSAPQFFALPADEEVAEMRVSMPVVWGLEEPVPAFVVPPSHAPKILSLLRPGELEDCNIADDAARGLHEEVATIVICTKDGKELQLQCYDWGHNPVVFTANGKDYYLGSSVDEQGHGIAGGVRIFRAIREAHAAQQK